MAKQFVFFYLMKDKAEQIRDVVPMHVSYWSDKGSANYTGGPFADRSGGMILFQAADMHSAEQLAHNDPFVIQDVIESSWVKEWIPAG